MSMEVDALYSFEKTAMYNNIWSSKFWNYKFCFLKIPCHITAIFHLTRKTCLKNLTHYMPLVSFYTPSRLNFFYRTPLVAASDTDKALIYLLTHFTPVLF